MKWYDHLSIVNICIVGNVTIKLPYSGYVSWGKSFVFEGENDFRGFYFHSSVSFHIKHRLRLTVSLSRGATSDHA